MIRSDDVEGSAALVILDPDQTALIKELDRVFTQWAVSAGAQEILAPPVYPVSDLEKFDVYKNFPQLVLVAGALDPARWPGAVRGVFDPAQLQDIRFGLPHATCYGAYLFHENRCLTADVLMTLVNRCFRNETHYGGLRRLMSFQMREIVAIGSYGHTQRVLAEFGHRVEAFAKRLGLVLDKVPATDPFFDDEGSRSLLQKLDPVKFEFQCGELAIASVNTHRNFFGERCGITLPGTVEFAFTSCVAFGLERWLAVLTERFVGDLVNAVEAVREAAAGED